MNVLDRPVLQLNGLWQAIDECTVRKAIENMMAENPKFPGLPVALGMAIDREGNLSPMAWDEWVKLGPIYDDYAIHCTNGRIIRAPTVVMSVNRRKPNMYRPKFCPENIFKRDKLIDVYTGQKIRREDATVEHIHPKSRGGARTSWLNVATAHRDVNMRKGCKTVEEAGLRLQYQPKEPPLVPAEVTLRVRHPDWNFFLVKSVDKLSDGS
jgi:hypothetical protein